MTVFFSFYHKSMFCLNAAELNLYAKAPLPASTIKSPGTLKCTHTLTYTGNPDFKKSWDTVIKDWLTGVFFVYAITFLVFCCSCPNMVVTCCCYQIHNNHILTQNQWFQKGLQHYHTVFFMFNTASKLLWNHGCSSIALVWTCVWTCLDFTIPGGQHLGV